VKEARTQTKLTPTPETRPTTIEGWTLREVVNGTAVIRLEGDAGADGAGDRPGGLYCSLGQSFGSRDEPGFNLDTVSARRPPSALRWSLPSLPRLFNHCSGETLIGCPLSGVKRT
jgi:hypothetical protein